MVVGWEKGRVSELEPLPVLSASSLLAACPDLREETIIHKLQCIMNVL